MNPDQTVSNGGSNLTWVHTVYSAAYQSIKAYERADNICPKLLERGELKSLLILRAVYLICFKYSKTCLKRPLKRRIKKWFSRPIIA